MSEKNTFEVYLKGGQVIEVKTFFTAKQLTLVIWDNPDERKLLIEFKDSDVIVFKNHISAIKDVTKKRAEAPIVERVDSSTPDRLANTIPAPYKPWEEEK